MTFSVLAGLKKFNISHNFEVKNIYEYYARWIQEGKLNVNSDWNKDLKIQFTVQDPCQIVRKSYGDPIAEDLRFVVKTVVGEENFIDMQPNRSNNCHAQIHELSDHYGGGYGVIHLWTIICLALGILGENEREYLLPEHKELALYG